MSAYDDAVRRVVEGQLRSFLSDHGDAVNWPHRVFMRSVAKRIVGDLTCAETRARLAVLGASTVSGPEERGGCCTAPRASDVGCSHSAGGAVEVRPAFHWGDLMKVKRLLEEAV